jgi:S1-C subfamily serine protease
VIAIQEARLEEEVLLLKKAWILGWPVRHRIRGLTLFGQKLAIFNLTGRGYWDKALLMKLSLHFAVFLAAAFSCFSADKMTSLTVNGRTYTNISDVHVSADGKIIVRHATGMTSTTEDKAPPGFLASWGITEGQLQSAQSTRLKTAEEDLDKAVRAGLFREVEGMVYDLRKPQPDWKRFYRAHVVQILDDGAICDVTPDDPRRGAIFVKHLPATLGDRDIIDIVAKQTGSYSYINKLDDDRTIRAYDAGVACKGDEIPDAIINGNKSEAKAIYGGQESRDVLAQLPENEELSASGTGFFITTDGYLLTNFHVVRGAKKLKVRTKSGVFPARVVKSDSVKDLALLKVAGQFKALGIAVEDHSQLGDSAFTIGFPNPEVQGLEPKYTDGKISSLAGSHDDPSEFQISVPVQPGNSGGPLIDQQGDAIGVVVARLNDLTVLAESGSLPQNVNYAIKANVVRQFLSTIPEVVLPSTKSHLQADESVKAAEEGVAMVLAY